MSDNPNKIQLHCNNCNRPRWHTTLCAVKKEWITQLDEPSSDFHELCNYRLAECNGCEHITLFMESSSSHQSESVRSQWPPKVSRSKPKWMMDLFLIEDLYNPFKQEFLNEIYSALKNNNLRLAVLGIRALIEQIMIEHIDDQGGFDKNLAEFEIQGYISTIQKAAIGPVIEAGHASMHRGFKATEPEVGMILDIVENLIESIYFCKQKASTLNIPEKKLKKTKPEVS